MSDNRVIYYAGELVDDMTRERLIEVINDLSQQIQNERSVQKRILDTWSACRNARR